MDKELTVKKVLQKRQESLSLADEFREWSKRLELIAKSLEGGDFFEPKQTATMAGEEIRSLFVRYKKLKVRVRDLVGGL